MENLKERIDRWLGQLDRKWTAMPAKSRRRMIIHLFAAYVLLTAIALLNICRDVKAARSCLRLEHIQDPSPAGKESPAVIKGCMNKLKD
ncbi:MULTISPECIES: hypothetical protein [Flavobacterium]|uniref:hypothetical protein n=1 Tax=Flavobacterium TaxID=237 RepID=UPI000272DC04|nr:MULTISPECIES: hypothetical protein [Flavobacterium]EJG02228.1 hypothetical protein FF52_06095 [Flavobacterium sp. F52]OXG00611.1 hypothetical protein B0A63_08845 [Flavobacterium johnsoniae UW101]WQG81758.1 nitrogen regulatory IIA protein [Flavobacterium johnsoniae UW101]SHK63419.1 hypothetical protein SAMN05444146_1728 [Flavobacterium johnsoniae]